MRKKLTLLLLIVSPFWLSAQFTNHWSQNFNEESSLVAGAVVGGGAGATAIFYNPATIAEISESKLSLNMSLYSYEYLNTQNAFGNGQDLTSSRLYIIPRYVSYILKPKNENWSIEFAVLNVANYQSEGFNSIDKQIDILTSLPGVERYIAYANLKNEFRNDYFGVAGSYKIAKDFYFGSTLFVSYKSNYSSYQLNINANPIEPVVSGSTNIPYYNASYHEQELVKYNDYRGMLKLGLFYAKPRVSMGLSVTTPSVGRIYSDGKRLLRQRDQNNITNPETGEMMANYLVMDYAEKNGVTVNSKTPLSVAAGVTYYNKKRTRIIYTTLEYFAGIEPYKMMEANENEDIAGGEFFGQENYSDWLTVVDGAKPILNVAIGYKWFVKENLTVMGGFKSNFSYKKDLDVYPFQNDKLIKNIDLDYYHFTGGATLHILGQELTAGIQYKLGVNKYQKQFANLTDPVEFNFTEFKALQGTRANTMSSFLHSATILVSATFNFANLKRK